MRLASRGAANTSHPSILELQLGGPGVCAPHVRAGGECPASVPRSRGSVKPSTFRGAQLPGIFKRGSGSVERAVVGRAERCREVVRAAARLHALRQPGGDMAVEGAGLVPGGEEEGKMRMNRRFDSVASTTRGGRPEQRRGGARASMRSAHSTARRSSAAR